MEQIKKHFAGTKVYNDVCQLLDTDKATFDLVDLTHKLYDELMSMLKKEGVTVKEKNNFYSIYCADFTLTSL